MNIEDSPRAPAPTAQRAWLLVVVLMIAGGFLGLLFARLQPPVYEASVRFSMSIDYVRSGPMTQFNEDHLLGSAGELIFSANSRRKTAEAAALQGIRIDPMELRWTARIERLGHVWRLRVQDANPETAATLANLWADIAMEDLEQAYAHALKKEGLERYLASVESCLQEASSIPNAQPYCSLASLEDLQTQLEQAQAAILEERMGARNISPALVFDVVQPADIPTQPARYNQGLRILAGMLIGFVAALIVLLLGAMRRSEK